MHSRSLARSLGGFVGLLSALTLVSCASAPERAEREAQQQRAEEQIAAILAAPQEDGSAAPDPVRCLSSTQWRNYRALDDRYLVFSGIGERLWLNRMPTRCPDLRFSHVLTVRSLGGINRICQSDTFRAVDWFDLPWYRRWPWQWDDPWHSGAICVFGAFHPITERQLDAIEESLDYAR